MDTDEPLDKMQVGKLLDELEKSLKVNQEAHDKEVENMVNLCRGIEQEASSSRPRSQGRKIS